MFRKVYFMNLQVLDKLCDFLEHGDIASLEQVYYIYKHEKKYRKMFEKKLLAMIPKVSFYSSNLYK